MGEARDGTETPESPDPLDEMLEHSLRAGFRPVQHGEYQETLLRIDRRFDVVRGQIEYVEGQVGALTQLTERMLMREPQPFMVANAVSREIGTAFAKTLADEYERRAGTAEKNAQVCDGLLHRLKAWRGDLAPTSPHTALRADLETVMDLLSAIYANVPVHVIDRGAVRYVEYGGREVRL